MISTSSRAMYLLLAIANVSVCSAQAFDRTAVYEALVAQEEQLGLDKTYYVRESNAIPKFLLDSSARYGYELAPGFQFPTEEASHAPEDFGRVSVRLVAESFLANLWDQSCQEGWEIFHQTYPDAANLTHLSAVAFNDQGDEAAVFIMHGGGCRRSWFATYHLQMEGRQWVIKGRLTAGAT